MKDKICDWKIDTQHSLTYRMRTHKIYLLVFCLDDKKKRKGIYDVFFFCVRQHKLVKLPLFEEKCLTSYTFF